MSTKTKNPSDLDAESLGLEEIFDISNDISEQAELLPTRAYSRDQMVHDEVEAVLADSQAMKSPETATAQLLRRLEFRVFEHNTDADTGKRRRTEFCWQPINVLPPYAIARLMMHFFHVRYIVTEDDTTRGLLGIYERETGLYSTDPAALKKIFVRFNKLLSRVDEERTLDHLVTFSERAIAEIPRRFVPVRNGLFDLETKTLNAFTPEHIFLSKIDVTLPETEPATPIYDDGRSALDLIVAPWPDDCYSEHFAGLLWQILRSVVTVSIGKAIHLYGAPKTGKSVFVDLCRAIVGANYSRRLSLADADSRFGLAGIQNAKLLYDAEMGGKKHLSAANVKMLITGDTLTIEAKHQPLFSYRNYALWIMAGNEGSMSSFDDKSLGVSDRFIHVPFTKKMSETRDSSVIEFLTSAEVLEWVLFHILHDVPDFKMYDLPPSVLQADAEINEEMGVMPGFVSWLTDTPEYMAQMAKAVFIPRDWIYDKYLLYAQESSPHSKSVMNLGGFMRALEPYLDKTRWQNVGDYQCTVSSHFWKLESEQRRKYSSSRVEDVSESMFTHEFYLRGRHRGLWRVADLNVRLSQDDVMLKFDDDPKREKSLYDCLTNSDLGTFFSTLYRDDVKAELVTKIDLPDAFLRRLLYPLGERSYEQKTRRIFVNGTAHEFTLERPQ